MIASYVLVDYDNAQPARLPELAKARYKVLVFLAGNQDLVSLELATALQRLGANGEYVRAPGEGQHALDLHIAYYVGKITSDNPHARIHVVSSDTRFDPLIEHLRNKHQAAASRSESLDAVVAAQTLIPPPLERLLESVELWLSNQPHHGPRTHAKLHNSLKSFLPKSVTKAERQLMITALRERGYFSTEGNKLVWQRDVTLPAQRPAAPTSWQTDDESHEPHDPDAASDWDDDDIPF